MNRKMCLVGWRGCGRGLSNVGGEVAIVNAIEAEIGFWWKANNHGGGCKRQLVRAVGVVVFDDVVVGKQRICVEGMSWVE